MASMLLRLPSPSLLLVNGPQPMFGTFHKLALPIVRERRVSLKVTTNATGDSSESSIVKSVQNVWNKPEDLVALVGLGFGGVIAFWTTINLVTTLDKVPLLPGLLELIGILFSLWFINRFLLYKPNRQELSELISKSISDVLGQ